MYKIANQIIDAYDDLYWDHLRKVAESRPETYIMTPEEKLSLGDDDYALSYVTKEAAKLNKYPIDSFDNTWLSNEYFPLTHHKLASEASKTAAHFIKKACVRFGIQPKEEVVKLAAEKVVDNRIFESSLSEKNFLNDLQDVVWISEKTASVGTAKEELKHFAEIDKICDNYTHAQFVFATPELVKVACQYFDEKHQKMPVELRHKYAAAIQMRAEELGMGAQKGTVAKYASDAYSADLDAHISSRRRLLDGSSHTAELNKLAAARKDFTPSQFAQLLHAFDKKASINQYYGGYLKNPYEATFTQSQTKYAWANKKAGKSLTEDEIRKVINDRHPKISEYLGNHVADEMKKDPISIFDSLPNDAKELIANIYDGSL